MKLIKTLFILALTNLALLVAILFYFSGRTPTPPISPQVPETIISPTLPARVLTVTPTKTQTPLATPKPTVAPTAVPNPLAGHCLITIDNVRYDVTNFRNQHSGGDVFTCGADLSQLFHDRHSNRFLDIMAQFRI